MDDESIVARTVPLPALPDIGTASIRNPTTMSDPRPLVLVVDDEPSIVELIVQVLEDEGCACLRAYNGSQAWNVLRSRHVDLLLSDIMMPGMDGLELLQLVRTSSH